MANYATDFQNLYSYLSFIYLRNIPMAKKSVSNVGKLLLSCKKCAESIKTGLLFCCWSFLSTIVIGAVVTQR